MAPTPTAVTIGGQQYPAGDLFWDQNHQQWISQNGQYYPVTNGQIAQVPGNPVGTPTQSFPGASTGDGSSGPQNPVDYSQLLPSASQYQSFSPLPYQQFGDTPQVAPATITAADVGSVQGPAAARVDLSSLPGVLSQYQDLIKQSLAPTFQQQNDALTASEAQRGIFNSTAGAKLQTDLQGQQAGALASAEAPLVQEMQGAYTTGEQQNASNQQESNLTGYQGLLSNDQLRANLQQEAAKTNQDAANNANTYNANAYGAVTGANYDAFNAYMDKLMGYQNTLGTGLVNSTLSSYDPNMYTGLLSQGLNNAGTAYTTAYTSGAPGTANLASTLGNLGAQLGKKSPASGGADMTNSSFGGY